MPELLIYANYYLLPVICLLLMGFGVRNALYHFVGKRFFSVFILLLSVGAIGELISWMPWEWPTGPYTTNIGSMISFAGLGGTAYFWFLYVYSRVKQTDRLIIYKKTLRTLILPLVIYYILLFTSPFTHLIYYVHPTYGYTVGILGAVPYLVAGFYIALSTVLIFVAIKESVLEDQKKEFQSLVYFMFFIIVGLIIQSYSYRWPAMLLCAVLSVVVVYLRILSVLSNLDDLTGLHNADQFYRYLELKYESSDNPLWALILIDIDDFKHINDSLGHVVGDKALCDLAVILRDVFIEKGTFISRCGGDEFAIIIDYQNESHVQERIDALWERVDEYNQAEKNEFQLCYSLGHVIYHPVISKAEDMMNVADRRMYEQKKEHKLGQRGGE